jgi:hypothetical protein
MAIRCKVVRGLAKEVEEEINKFLSVNPVRVMHIGQSESGNHISVTLLFEDVESVCLPGIDEDELEKGRRP